MLYLNPYNEELLGDGYAQISELDDFACDAPEDGKYSKYIVHDTPGEDDKTWERYCGDEKASDSECEIKGSWDYYEKSECYGVKTYASQYSIIDVVEVSYDWCWEVTDG